MRNIELYPQGRRQHGGRQVFRIVAALDLILAVAVMLGSEGPEGRAKPMLPLILRPGSFVSANTANGSRRGARWRIEHAGLTKLDEMGCADV